MQGPDFWRDRLVWVAGHRGMVGGALIRRLGASGARLLTATRGEVDLRRQADTEAWMAAHRPDIVFLAAATVGGILANDSRPGEFLYDNLAIAANVIEGARRIGAAKLVFLGSTCVYPKMAAQPIEEDALLSGPLEPTNEWYAVAKIAGLKMCAAYRRQYGCDFIAAHPSNLYGPGDDFDLAGSHVLPALIRKAHEAKQAGAPALTVWGSGAPLREFTHVDDLAHGLVFAAEHYAEERAINIGSGEEITIADLARLVADVVGFEGMIAYDRTKPDGAPRKIANSDRIRALGWAPRIPLRQGVADAYAWYLEHAAEAVA